MQLSLAGNARKVEITCYLITNLNLPTPVLGELIVNALTQEAERLGLEDLVLSMPACEIQTREGYAEINYRMR